MTEDEARRWLAARFAASTIDRLETFVERVRTENDRQNLVSRSSLDAIWTRHVVDSAQLIAHAEPGLWIDVGTGGGFPGLVVAICREEPIYLVEPRRKRADFLATMVGELGLSNATVVPSRVERLAVAASIISARAVGTIDGLIDAAASCSTERTRWILPRGFLSCDDRERLGKRFAGMFHVKQSVTDHRSLIVILEQVTAA